MNDSQIIFKNKFFILLLIIFISIPLGFLLFEYLSKKEANMQKEISLKEKILSTKIIQKKNFIKSANYFNFSGKEWKGKSRGDWIGKVCITRDNKVAFISVVNKGIYVISLENPLKPTLLSVFYRYWQGSEIVLSKDEQTLYSVNNMFDIFSLDVSNPKNPVLLVAYDTGKRKYIKYKNNMINSNYKVDSYTCNGISAYYDSAAGKCLKYKDNSIYSNYYKQGIGTGELTISDDNKKLFFRGTKGIEIFDISKKNRFEFISHIDHKAIGYQSYKAIIEINKNIIYASTGRTIDTIDITNIKNPTVVNSFDTKNIPLNIALSPNKHRGYITTGKSTIESIGIVKQKFPKKLSLFNVDGNVDSITVSNDGKRLFVSARNSLQIFDISYIYEPKIIATLKAKQRTKNKKCQITNSVLNSNENILYASSTCGLLVVELDNK